MSTDQILDSKKTWLTSDSSNTRTASFTIRKFNECLCLDLILSDDYTKLVYDFCVNSEQSAQEAMQQLSTMKIILNLLIKSLKKHIEQGTIPLTEPEDLLR
jgi:hypothetical protein